MRDYNSTYFKKFYVTNVGNFIVVKKGDDTTFAIVDVEEWLTHDIHSVTDWPGYEAVRLYALKYFDEIKDTIDMLYLLDKVHKEHVESVGCIDTVERIRSYFEEEDSPQRVQYNSEHEEW